MNRRAFIVRSVAGPITLMAWRAGLLTPSGIEYASPAADESNPAWVALGDLSSAEYQAEFDRRVAQGWRLVDVSGYESGGQGRYAAIWEQSGGPAWQARHGLTFDARQAAFD